MKNKIIPIDMIPPSYPPIRDVICEFCGSPVWSSGFNGRPFCWVKCYRYVEGKKQISITGERLDDDTIEIDGKFYRRMTDAEYVEFVWGEAK
jgi:endogenous inhibitor of DNA gyrase (YacG/DUF329 family)